MDEDRIEQLAAALENHVFALLTREGIAKDAAVNVTHATGMAFSTALEEELEAADA